jgi:hypothetical protein
LIELFKALVRICVKARSAPNGIGWLTESQMQPFILAVSCAATACSVSEGSGSEKCSAANLFTQLVTSTIERLAHVQLLEPDGLAGNRQVFPVVEMYRHILGATDKQSLGVPPYNLDMFLAHVVGFRNMNAHAASEKALGALAVRHDPRVMALLSATIAEAAADLMTRTLLPLSWTIGTISPSRTGHTVLKAPRSFVNHPLGEEI